MKSRKFGRAFAMIVTLSLLLFSTTAYALSAGIITLENSNHDYTVDQHGNYTGTDTLDYCMEAHDVQITLSVMEKLIESGEDALRTELEQASQYIFILRNGFNLLTEGWETDVSRVKAEVTDEGYPVTVTLPSITEGIVSTITYRVYVVADPYTPPSDYKGYVENGDISIYYVNTLTVFASQWKEWGAENIQDYAITELLRYEAINQSSNMPVPVTCKASVSDFVIDPLEYPATFEAIATFTAESAEVVSGTVTVTVIEDPEPTMYTLTIRYIDGDGQNILDTYTAQYQDGAEYDITNEALQSIPGYEYSAIKGMLTGIISSDIEIVVSYNKVEVVPPSFDNDDYRYYSVTVRYVDQKSGKELIDAYRSSSIQEGQRYDVSKQADIAIDGYTVAEISGETNGRINMNITVTVYYTATEDEPVIPGTEDDTGGFTGETLPDEDVVAPIVPATSDMPTQDEAGNLKLAVLDNGVDELTNTSHILSDKKEASETNTIPIDLEVPFGEGNTHFQMEDVDVGTIVNQEGGNLLNLILTAMGCTAVAGMGISIMSDISVLRWYENRKKREIRL